ncbi:MAG: aldehyde dehydrogenase family protein [Actinomycetota bacterium]
MADEQQMFIGGKWTDAAEGGRLDVINPATGEVFATVPSATERDVELAVESARNTFDDGEWPARTSGRDRGRILLRAAEIIRRERDRLAGIETRDNGKPIGDAREDVDEAAFIFEYYGGWATKISGEIPTTGPDSLSIVLKEPAGVAVAITPWNYPIVMASQKIAPAIAAGCTTILKPASFTPMTSLELGKVLEEAGLPAGVLQVVTGPGSSVGAALVRSPSTDVISLTGSGEVGKFIMREAADTLKRVSLELGGKSPNIFFADADFEAAVEGACNGVFWNQGEICSAGTRVFVEKSIYDDALNAMTDHAKAIKLGDGLDPDTSMGPLVSKQQQDTVQSYIEIGMKEAKLAAQGETPSDPKLAGGYFVPPTIFADADNDDRISREEIFGPVMTVIPFEDVDEVVRMSNDNPYGLAAAIWTNNIKKALNTAKAIRAGTIWINDTQPAPSEAPWGGYKQSGFGRELGAWGLEDYLEVKHVYVNLDEG